MAGPPSRRSFLRHPSAGSSGSPLWPSSPLNAGSRRPGRDERPLNAPCAIPRSQGVRRRRPHGRNARGPLRLCLRRRRAHSPFARDPAHASTHLFRRRHPQRPPRPEGLHLQAQTDGPPGAEPGEPRAGAAGAAARTGVLFERPAERGRRLRPRQRRPPQRADDRADHRDHPQLQFLHHGARPRGRPVVRALVPGAARRRRHPHA